MPDYPDAADADSLGWHHGCRSRGLVAVPASRGLSTSPRYSNLVGGRGGMRAETGRAPNTAVVRCDSCGGLRRCRCQRGSSAFAAASGGASAGGWIGARENRLRVRPCRALKVTEGPNGLSRSAGRAPDGKNRTSTFNERSAGVKTEISNEEIRVTLLGTGTPILDINRFGMSTLVEAGRQKLLFDAGRGVVIRLHQKRVPTRDINAIFITHLHSDHLTGLPDLYASALIVPLAMGGRKNPLDLWGPVGIDNVARGIELMFTDNNRLRAGEITQEATTIKTHQLSEGVVYEQDGVKVTAFLVNHGHVVPAYGYRVDYGTRSVVLSGDTAYSPNLVAQAKGVDLLIHCIAVGSARLEQLHWDFVRQFYELLANPEVVGKILTETRPRDAVFSHISLYSQGDISRATEEELTSRVRAGYDGPFVIGQDLMSFTIRNDRVVREPYSAQIRFKASVT
jgi:ribonuclease Z